MKLTEFDIKYEPRKAIKSQAPADFIVELPQAKFEVTNRPAWTLHVDGASGVERI